MSDDLKRGFARESKRGRYVVVGLVMEEEEEEEEEETLGGMTLRDPNVTPREKEGKRETQKRERKERVNTQNPKTGDIQGWLF